VRKKAPQRTPHPDPAVELRLQRILDLRASITRTAALAEQYRHEIGKLYYEARCETSSERAEMFMQEATALHDRIMSTETAITGTQQQIAALQAEIAPDDLAYL
jgi:hypothetical protein